MNVLVLKDEKQRKRFLRLSVVTVPVLTYLYTLPISFIAWAIIFMFDLSVDTEGMAVMVIELVYCALASGATHYYIWQHRAGGEEKLEAKTPFY